MTALEMFREGLDTAEIAARLGVSEAAASRMVYEQRSRLKDLPVQYERYARRSA